MEGYEQARVLFEEIGDPHGAAIAGAAIGVMHVALSSYPEAQDRLRGVLPVLRAAGDLPCQVYVLRGLGTTQLDLGHLGDAARLFQEGVDLARRTGYRYGLAHLLRWFARVRIEQGGADEAAALLAESLDIFRQLRCRMGEAMTLLSLGQLHLLHGRARQARPILEQSLRISAEIGEGMNEAYSLLQLGSLDLADGRAG